MKPSSTFSLSFGSGANGYPIQVKQMDKVGRPDIDNFEASMIRANRKKGFFVGFDYSQDALSEIDGLLPPPAHRHRPPDRPRHPGRTNRSKTDLRARFKRR